MKTKNLFAFALAAMTFAACSNEDAPEIGGNGESNGEIIDAISVAFTNPKNTYAYVGTENGVGSENDVFTAYIFAKENNPGHAGALTGDWTVKEVSNGGSAILEGDESTPGTRKNLATFNGVRQGDNVYVIANDPNMTMAIAEGLAHNAATSEATIKAYISGMDKKYLNDLTVAADGTQDGEFIMAGKATIPTNPTIANGSTVKIPVELNRELAKVTFSASVTADPTMEAYQKVKIQAGDGLVIARVARKASFFTAQDRDWYFPLDGDGTTKDWGYKADGTEDWTVAFDGDANSAPATASTPYFNETGKAGAKEYRFTWDTNSALIDYTAPATSTDGGKIASPFFYVTPNYANNSACATVIVTQATYTGNTTLVPEVTSAMLDAALLDGTFNPGGSMSSISEDYWNTKANVTALLTFLQGDPSYQSLFPASDYADADALIDYEKDVTKLYYRADIANYEADNTTSQNVTERNTFYKIKGTITSLGAKSISGAIDSDNINMIVQVTVKPWNVVVNQVNM